MGDFTLNTADQKRNHVVIDGHRWEVIGVTRTLQRAFAANQAAVHKLQAEAGESTNGDMPDLADEMAALLIDTIAIRLRPTGDAPDASTFLTGLWESDDLTVDEHLTPLVQHLYGEETQPVPPA